MTKTQAIKIFGSREALVAALGGNTVTAISKWPEVLTTSLRQRVIGAAYESGKMRQYNKVMKKL